MVMEVVVTEKLGANRDGEPRHYVCASNAAISKGDICILSSGRVAAAHSTGALGIFAGVAAMEKSNGDYSTSVSCLTNFIGNFQSSLAISVGDLVGTDVCPNRVKALTANTSSHGIVVGIAYSTVATATRVPVRVLI